MGGSSKSDSSQDTSNTDNRTGASDEALAVGANSEIRIRQTDPGILEFGKEILDFGETLTTLAEEGTAAAGQSARDAIAFAEGQVRPAEGRQARLMSTVAVSALAAWAIAQVAK